MHRFGIRVVLLGASLLSSTAAMAQQAGEFDTGQLPAFHGKVALYNLTPSGEVGGVILDDGTEVMMPPHLSDQVVAAVKPGDGVTIHGLKARTLKMVQAMSLTNDAMGATVVGGPGGPGPGGQGGRPRGGAGMDGQGQRPSFGQSAGGGTQMSGGGTQMTDGGIIKMQLHGPRGDLDGVLLQDGTFIRMPPPEAARVAAQLTPGAALYVSGEGNASAHGKVIAAREIGPSADRLVRFQPPTGQQRPPMMQQQ